MYPNKTKNRSIPEWISMQEATRHVPYSQEYVSLLARRGKLFAKKIGRNWYTTREALATYIAEESILASSSKFATLTDAPVLSQDLPTSDSNLVEEFKRLNPQVFNKSKEEAKNKESGTMIHEPANLNVVPTPVVSVSEDSVVLGKLDRLSESLEAFVSSRSNLDEIPVPSQSAPRFRGLAQTPTKLVALLVTAIIITFVLVGGFSFCQALTKVQNLWASGDIIVQGITKTYYNTRGTLASVVDDISSIVVNWGSRSITIANTADDTTKALFVGPAAQAADQSKVDLVNPPAGGGAYLATYGVDSTRGEIQLTGTSQIINGEAKIYFDYSFSSIIASSSPIRVLVTPTTMMQGQLYVDTKSAYGFVTKELNATDNGTFDWLVIARRRGFEGTDIYRNSDITTSPTPSPTPQPIVSESPTSETTASSPSSPEPSVSPSESPTPAPSDTPAPPTETVSPTPTPESTSSPTPEPAP